MTIYKSVINSFRPATS